MGDYTAIADVGQTLLKLLREKMPKELVGQPESILLAPPVDSADIKLSIFLYKITENNDRNNHQMIRLDSGLLQYPPIEINLHYLITAFSSANEQSKDLDQHRMLGKVIEILNDNKVARGSMLQGSLSQKNEEIKIIHENLSLDQLNHIWSLLDMKFRLSLGYRVEGVRIDSKRVKEVKRVLQRDIRFEEG